MYILFAAALQRCESQWKYFQEQYYVNDTLDLFRYKLKNANAENHTDIQAAHNINTCTHSHKHIRSRLHNCESVSGSSKSSLTVSCVVKMYALKFWHSIHEQCQCIVRSNVDDLLIHSLPSLSLSVPVPVPVSVCVCILYHSHSLCLYLSTTSIKSRALLLLLLLPSRIIMSETQ